MQTVRFSATLGVVPGYHHNNQLGVATYDPAEIVASVWQQEAEKVFLNNGVYPGANISNSITVYRPEWGCPIGGENTVQITGEANPAFIEQNRMGTFKECVLDCLKSCSIILGQTTTQITFTDVDFFYIQNEQE